MLRYGRDRFFAFGILQVLCAAALLLHALSLATGSGSGEAALLPILLGLAALCLVAAAAAAVKRGRDIGWGASGTLLAFFVCASLSPLLLVLVAYLALAPGKPGDGPLGPQSTPMSATAWLWALLGLFFPLMIVLTASRTL